MKYLAKLTLTLVISILVGALIDGARASDFGSAGASTPVKHPAKKAMKSGKKKALRKTSFGGEALKPKTSLKFDGRSVEALRAGKYDSLSIGDDGAKGAKRLYDLPANFQSRAADSESEMRYRQ